MAWQLILKAGQQVTSFQCLDGNKWENWFDYTFLKLINLIRKCPQKNEMGVHLVTNYIISLQPVPDLLSKPFSTKVSTFDQLNKKMPNVLEYQMYLIYKLLSQVLHLRIYVLFAYLLNLIRLAPFQNLSLMSSSCFLISLMREETTQSALWDRGGCIKKNSFWIFFFTNLL